MVVQSLEEKVKILVFLAMGPWSCLIIQVTSTTTWMCRWTNGKFRREITWIHEGTHHPYDLWKITNLHSGVMRWMTLLEHTTLIHTCKPSRGTLWTCNLSDFSLTRSKEAWSFILRETMLERWKSLCWLQQKISIKAVTPSTHIYPRNWLARVNMLWEATMIWLDLLSHT